MRTTVIVMVKEPVAGRVKTRLGRDIGMSAAAWWYRHQTRRLLRRLRDRRWNIVLAVSPDRTLTTSRTWPQDLPRCPQGGGDLGERMARMLRMSPPAPVLLIGSDIPGITRTRLARAFQALRGSDCVLGPSEDGGYWLVGVRAPHLTPRDAFRDVRWSGPHAMADTIRSFQPLRIAQTATLRDVDDASDLGRA